MLTQSAMRRDSDLSQGSLIDQAALIDSFDKAAFAQKMHTFLIRLEDLEERLSDVNIYDQRSVNSFANGLDENLNYSLYVDHINDALTEVLGTLGFDQGEFDFVKLIVDDRIPADKFKEKIEELLKDHPANTPQGIMVRKAAEAVYNLDLKHADQVYGYEDASGKEFSPATAASKVKTVIGGIVGAFFGGLLGAAIGMLMGAGLGFAFGAGNPASTVLGAQIGSCLGFLYNMRNGYQDGASYVNTFAAAKYSINKTISATQSAIAPHLRTMQEEVKKANTATVSM